EGETSSSAVGTLSTTDTDTGQSFTYALVTGSGSTDNSMFTITGNTLTLASNVPLPTQASFSIRVRSTDSGFGALSFDKVLTISINHTPTDIALSDNRVFEGETSGSSVGTLSTTDADSGQTFAYALVAGSGSADNGLFTVVGNTLKLGSNV